MALCTMISWWPQSRRSCLLPCPKQFWSKPTVSESPRKVSRLGLAVRLLSRTSVRFSFGSPSSLQKLLSADILVVTLSLTIKETLKWLSSLPILMQESFWWWQCSDRYLLSLFPHLHTPFPPFSPSLISLVVSVDVKHHVYLLINNNNNQPTTVLLGKGDAHFRIIPVWWHTTARLLDVVWRTLPAKGLGYLIGI